MIVAAFDFDGTVTEGDTLLPYLERVVGRRRLLSSLMSSAPWFARAALWRGSRDAAKERLLRRCLGGLSVECATKVAEVYAQEIVLRDDVVAMLRAHLDEGHQVLLVSASPGLYVRVAARLLGVHDVVATELEARDGVLTGRCASRNCRGEEKRRRLEAWIGGRDVELHAYGNSVDDEPMLALADHAVRV